MYDLSSTDPAGLSSDSFLSVLLAKLERSFPSVHLLAGETPAGAFIQSDSQALSKVTHKLLSKVTHKLLSKVTYKKSICQKKEKQQYVDVGTVSRFIEPTKRQALNNCWDILQYHYRNRLILNNRQPKKHVSNSFVNLILCQTFVSERQKKWNFDSHTDTNV